MAERSRSRFMVPQFVLLTALGLSTCKAPPQRPDGATQPVVRVGILEHRQFVEFRFDGKANFEHPGSGLVMRGVQGGRWRVEAVDSRPAEFVYRLAVGTTGSRIRAEEIVRSLANKKLTARIVKLKRPQSLRLPYVSRSLYQVVLSKEFKDEKEARAYQNLIQPKTGSEMVAVPRGQAAGFLRFTNLETQYSFDARETVRLDAARIQVLDVDVGSGYHWQKSEDRAYSGTFEFVIDAYGLITAVNELPLETYLKGVVPSEMPVSFPAEALKAQAVAARVEAVTKIGVRHPFEPFDLCDDVHCQVFTGTSKVADASSRAVESTRGIFMIYRKELAEAFYSGLCGGHTENNENVWLMDAKPYLRGVLDRDGSGRSRLRTSLQEEKNLRKWVDSSPNVFCNTTRGNVPASVGYSKKYFRWKVEYTRSQLEAILREKTGRDFGALVDLVPLKRGVSGRLKELEVVGTKERFVLSRELPIRQALSKSTLYSAAFYVSKRGGPNGLPDKIILKGAGWGHGVGMCQIGAAVMAHKGFKFDQILRHYYTDVFLEALYR